MDYKLENCFGTTWHGCEEATKFLSSYDIWFSRNRRSKIAIFSFFSVVVVVVLVVLVLVLVLVVVVDLFCAPLTAQTQKDTIFVNGLYESWH